VTTYMLSGSLGITADDPWGVRSGLLHTRTLDWTWSRKGKARQVCYSRGQDGTTMARMQRALSLNPDRVFVDVDELCKLTPRA